jgi:photosystem II stability/assembly factor-like uncharacterized protein
MIKIYRIELLLLLLFLLPFSIFSQEDSDDLLSDKTFSGFKMRNIGPAFMSGRIADVVIHPENENTWYLAVGSGGVWKTENAGVTWTPIFDNQPVYSIGCLALDPENPHVVWVGTGENVGGRHVGFGDGIYKSEDGGASWNNVGLKESQHISKIIVHPENSDVVWVAAQGPLWNKGGERGVYKTIDGGKTWNKTLGDEEWTGATDLLIDPRDPNRLYAATWQRGRTVAAYMGGGPGTAIYRSEDGGDTWIKLKSGLPSSTMGKIGLAISPQQPDVIYAVIELERRTGGVYKSTDRGASWKKQSETVSGATGPHYYQELYASPHTFDKLYLMDVRIQVSDNGGKTFSRLSEKNKHSDNHAIAFKASQPDYLLVGTDGGLYESFDQAENWRFISNLPVTQFYKVAVDDAKPFYFIYGGTQDNGTQRGPSQTDNSQGITNEDWNLVLWADGHQPATEPGNPNIVYAEAQEGYLYRIDIATGEKISIQPQPGADEGFERFNWDSPILVSPHAPTTLYYASQRVWKSENRGDSWEAISGDLTKNQERITLPIMDKTWSWDSPWDVYAMSTYNTISSLAESPLQEGLLYAGTDDGLIQVTEDGGKNWKKIAVGSLPTVPETAFVNDIKADLFDANTVYVALDNHKFGDFSPYLFKSTNKGKTWKSISGNIPKKTLVWRIVQDHVNKDLLFAATEFGIYFTLDGGQNWIKITGGVPTISFRDLAIQRQQNDLVGASFGRSFYVFDDYSVLRDVSEDQLKEEATLFPVPDANWYFPKMGKGSQGASFFVAENPPFGAVFTYYLNEAYKTETAIRKEKEKKLEKENQDIPFPGWDELEEERKETAPKIWLTVKDENGNIIRRLPGRNSKGFHREEWDLQFSRSTAINSDSKNQNFDKGDYVMAGPGTYSVTLSKEIDGVETELSSPESFKVVKLYKGTLVEAEPADVVAFWKEVRLVEAQLSIERLSFDNATKELNAMDVALSRATKPTGDLSAQLYNLRQQLYAVEDLLKGNQSKNEIGEKDTPTIYNRLNAAKSAVSNSTYGPTETAIKSLEIASAQLEEIKAGLKVITEQTIPELKKKLVEVGAPVVK